MKRMHLKIILDGAFMLFYSGSSDIDQLGKIFAAFGTPKPAQWSDMVYLPDYVEYQYVPAPPLRSLFPMASDDALDLLSKMFAYDPKVRLSAQQALKHRYFTSPPTATNPASLPRPSLKGDNTKAPETNPNEGPTVLSPPRKHRRVMPNRSDAGDENFHNAEKVDDHVSDSKLTSGPSSSRDTGRMSIDFSTNGSKPPPRPTINSADRTHLKRKLDLEFQMPE